MGAGLLRYAVAQRGWRVSKLDVESAFLQPGLADLDVYGLPPRESSDRKKVLWLLFTAACGLINADANWQVQSDALMYDNRLIRPSVVPQLFLHKKKTDALSPC